jgi:AcrR family transcriptional regulator
MSETTEKNSQTRERLLEVAGEQFAEHGFRGATVRDICKAAEANVAAVNYHFGDKEGLYAAVLKYAHRCAVDQFPSGSPEGATPAEKLRHYVASMLHRMLNAGRPAWQGKLMAREIVEPTAALDQVVEESIRPQSMALEAIVGEILGPGADPAVVRDCARSVIGQCFFYRHAAPVLERLSPGHASAPGWIERAAGHITRFSLAALEGMASEESSR